MLILAVHVDERIFIGEDIVLMFCAHKSDGSIALGFEAPRHVEIDRGIVRNVKRLGLPRVKPAKGGAR